MINVTNLFIINIENSSFKFVKKCQNLKATFTQYNPKNFLTIYKFKKSIMIIIFINVIKRKKNRI